jgi:tyrosyl-tRNA synthetase
MPEQVVFLMPLLVGTDGVQKMSKSYGNYVGVAEDPKEQFGKLMSISDDTMATYYRLLLGREVPVGHPMDAKKQFAASIVERFHGADAAKAALEDFNTRFSKRDLADADLPEVAASLLSGDAVTVVVAAYAQAFQMTKSRGDARRLVEQGSVQVNGEKMTDPKATPAIAAGTVIRLDKTRAIRAV